MEDTAKMELIIVIRPIVHTVESTNCNAQLLKVFLRTFNSSYFYLSGRVV